MTDQRDRSRRLRRDQTDAERTLWWRLRGRQVSGAKFRRQHGIGQYVVDFCCHERRLVVELLARETYEVYTFSDGREVMPPAKTHQPDLILLDINLPHIDGLTLARMLREDPETRAVTILAVSAYSVAGDEERMRQAGCVDSSLSRSAPRPSFRRPRRSSIAGKPSRGDQADRPSGATMIAGGGSGGDGASGRAAGSPAVLF